MEADRQLLAQAERRQELQQGHRGMQEKRLALQRRAGQVCNGTLTTSASALQSADMDRLFVWAQTCAAIVPMKVLVICM